MRGLLKRIEVGGRRLLYRSLDRAVNSAETGVSVPEGERLDRVLLMRQDRIGDMVMTLPLIRKLREVHGLRSIGVVASEPNSIVLKHEEGVDLFVSGKAPADFVSSLIRVREYAPDAVVDMHMHDSTTSLVYALASGARWRLHVDRHNRLPFNIRVTAPFDGHIMDAFSALLSGLGRELPLERLDREVRNSREEEEFARRFWEASDPSPGDCAVVNISAGGPDRDWGTDRYVSVCRDLLAMGLVPLLLSSPSDRRKAEGIGIRAVGALVSPPTPTILHLAALLRGTALLISPDTSVVHLAASMGVPVVGMYLPRDPSLPEWYPWKVPCRVITSESAEDLGSIHADGVVSAVRELVALSLGR
ncbi:MAG: hypothetical protein AVO35_10500 [Candidatus Aegiribacteria sp. MLS_C]|nr:MAG: hypothetical protein AVO35_10500 [Candidatus Aegiribacteria sp. MLS_C]